VRLKVVDNEDNVLITICARAGSKGVKNKNLREIAGKPLIAYTIEQAKRWGGAAHVVCSTESDDIANVAVDFGAEVLFKRPVELASDTASKLDVIRHAIEKTEEIKSKHFSIIIDLDVTAPIRKIKDIEGACQLFLEKKPQCIFSVTHSRKNPYFNQVEINESGFARLSKDSQREILRRQDAPIVYDMNASIYVYEREFLFDENHSDDLNSGRLLVWVMDDLSAFDVDTPADCQFVEYLISSEAVKID